MKDAYKTMEGLTVSVDKVMYLPTLEAPPEKPYPFVYFITILNQSDQAVTIQARKWVVAEEAGETVVVEGEGVVGATPHIAPGEHFSYNSYHVVASDASAKGAFFGVTDSGEVISVRIPDFELQLP